MRLSLTWRMLTPLAILAVGLTACGSPEPQPPVRESKRGDVADGSVKNSATQRASRRAYDGAPPVIFHQPLGIECTQCHSREGMQVDGVGFAPPSPHESTAGLSLYSRCEQCHVYTQADDLFIGNTFAGLRQDLRKGGRLYPGAPPTVPHKIFMRENCQACHTGPAAREEIRTSHPERVRCRQCHVEVQTTDLFVDNNL